MRMNGGLRTLKSAYVGDMDGDSDTHPAAYHLQPGSGMYLQQGQYTKLNSKQSNLFNDSKNATTEASQQMYKKSVLLPKGTLAFP